MFVPTPVFDPRLSFEWIGTDGSRWDLVRGPHVKLTTTNVRGITMPEVEYQQSSSAYTDGVRTDGMRLKERTVYLPLKFETTDVVGVQRDFWRSMTPGKFGELRVGDGMGGTRSIRLKFGDDGGRGLRIDPNVDSDLFGITMMADDPWFHGPSVPQPFDLAEAVAPRSMFGQEAGDPPLFIMSSYVDQFTTVENPGDVDAWPVWRILGTGDNGVTAYEVWVGDQLLSATTAIPVDHTLTIDTDPRQLTATLTGPLVTDDGDRTGDFDSIGFASIAPLGQARVKIVLAGSGVVTVELEPRYFMGV